MSRKGNPYDNAACESFMKTLKYEEAYRNEHRDFQEAPGSIREFLVRRKRQAKAAVADRAFCRRRVTSPVYPLFAIEANIFPITFYPVFHHCSNSALFVL
jgi:transposase InsO family protein